MVGQYSLMPGQCPGLVTPLCKTQLTYIDSVTKLLNSLIIKLWHVGGVPFGNVCRAFSNLAALKLLQKEGLWLEEQWPSIRFSWYTSLFLASVVAKYS